MPYTPALKRALSVGAIAIGLFVPAACGDGDGGGLAVGPAELVWEDSYDAGTDGGDTDRTQDEAREIAACDGRVFIVGQTSPLDSGTNDFVVRAYDASTGELLWSDRVESGAHDDARSVVCDNERVLVTLTSGFNDPVAVLRAHAPHDGTLLWESLYEDRFGNNPTDLWLDDDTAFISITAWDEGPDTDPTSAATVIITRAIDSANGNIVWENQYDAGQPAARGTLAVGRNQACAIHQNGGGLRCFDRDDGALRWSADAGSGDSDDIGLSSDESVVVVSTYSFATRLGSLIAYDAESGAGAWQHDYELATIVSPLPAESLFLVAGNEFVIDDDFDEETVFLVEARDVATGELVWSDRRPGFHAGGYVVDGPRAVVAASNWDSRVYEVSDGTILSDERAPDSPPTRGISGVAVDAGRYFLGGTLWSGEEGPRDRDIGVRGYRYP